jgi:enamine deaminase RidA (YjgF/YER057c/UK114 family)
MQKRNRRPPVNELVTIRRISSGGTFEAQVGYCRAVVAGGFVYVAGTTAQGADIPNDAAGQCKSALETIRATLDKAGSGMEHVVRVTYMLPDRGEFPACWPALKEAFGAHPPAATMIECGLIDPKYRIEIEVTALLPG